MYKDYNSFKKETINIVKKDLENTAWSVSRYFDINGVSDFENIRILTKNRVTIIKTDGEVLFDTDSNTKESHKYRQEVQEAINNEQGFSIRKSKTVNKKLIYYSILYSDKIILRVAAPYEIISEPLQNQIIQKLFLYLLLNLFLIFVYNYILKKYYINKIKEIKEVIESGNIPKSMYLEEDIELNDFWKVIKEWQKKNLKNIEELEKEKVKLSKLISLIDIGVIMFDEDKNILAYNREFKYSFFNNLNTLKYYEKIDCLDIIEVLNKLYSVKERLSKEIYLTDYKKYYFIKGRYLKNEKLYILSARDITQSKEIKEIEKRFISNISHELKTPLTNIKGYLIALRDEEDENIRNNFLNIAENNIEKLENIIQDFLNIQKIEASNVLNKYPTDINKLFKEILEILNGIIEKKNVDFKYELKLKGKEPVLNIDREKIKVLLKNLIENSIIYNDKKNPKIRVRIEEEESYINIYVSDNGIGIPKSEQKNIFNRFYRVDKARTSNKSGTGLGLSIVKEITELYSGIIDIRSQEGEGTTFKIKLLK